MNSKIHWPPRRGSALLIILAFVTLITVLVVSLLLITRYERTASALALGRIKSDALANYAADLAMERMREAIDDGRTLALPAYNTWVSEPGRIHLISVAANGSMARTSRDLFSALPGADDAQTADLNNVDLNKAGLTGQHPITGSNPGTMKVGWRNLLADPSAPAGPNNQIVGRIAYWVDDESCKVNVNTADGSQKYTPASFGFGTPSEINLQALSNGNGSTLSQTQAAAISQYAWTYGFNSPPEISRVPGVPAACYQANQFNLTTSSKTPELTFFGEPRIYLFPVVHLTTAPNANVTRSALNNAYGAYDPTASAFATDASKMTVSDEIDFVYPTSQQLPRMKVVDSGADGIPDAETLMQYAPQYSNGRITKTSTNYHFAARMAFAMNGLTSQNIPFAWPAFPGTSTGGLSAKYNDRQLDAIALNIFDAAIIEPSVNQGSGYAYATVTTDGMLSHKTVIGIGRTPILTEMFFTIDAFKTEVSYTNDAVSPSVIVKTPNIPALQMDMQLEFYIPTNFSGDSPYFSDFQIGSEGSHNKHAINQNDNNGQYVNNFTDNIQATYETPMGGYWQDKLLRFVDGSNSSKLAGIDMRAHNRTKPDPETAKSTTYHSPYSLGKGGCSWPPDKSAASTTSLFYTVLQTYGPAGNTNYWVPGAYHAMTSTGAGTVELYGDPSIPGFSMTGGVSLWGRNGSGGISWEIVPLDSIRSRFDGVDPKTVIPELQDAVVPVPANMQIPFGSIDYVWTGRVADPLVNKFPGDWIVKANPPSSDVTIHGARTVDATKVNGGVYTTTGDNPEYQPINGGDPLTVWLPRQDVTYSKQSRFPSVGALNFLRTGIIPDDLSVPVPQQKGTPWRTVNLASTSQASQTLTGESGTITYPDWVMLDLFTVPFIPQRAYLVGGTPTQKRTLTYGGATEGKLNINNPKVPYPFSLGSPNTNPPERTAPLDALFYGIKTALSYSGMNPVYTPINQSKAADLRDAVQNYLSTNGPFILPGQLAEVPAINAYTYTGVSANAQSRNDLMREVVGATTTQSNVFSVWVVAQTIQKKPGNVNYGTFEPGDAITGETRRQYVVERFIETGRDGVPGNPLMPALDKDRVMGTSDDPIDANYHPSFANYPLPYRWRVLSISNSNS